MGNYCVTSKSYIDEKMEIKENQFHPIKILEPQSLRNISRRNSTPYRQKNVQIEDQLQFSLKPKSREQFSRILDDGSYYEGDQETINFYKGKLKSQNGEYYEGIFNDKKIEGYGKFQRNDGIYVGQWKEGQQHGKGKDIWNDKSFYQGTYLNGLKHGKGMFKFQDGSTYEGDWVADKMEGYVFQKGYLQMVKWLHLQGKFSK